MYSTKFKRQDANDSSFFIIDQLIKNQHVITPITGNNNVKKHDIIKQSSCGKFVMYKLTLCFKKKTTSHDTLCKHD